MDRKEKRKKDRKKGWATSPSRSKGLRELRPLDHIWVELLLESVDPKKKFTVRDPSGELLFYGGERQENFLSRGRGRRFHMTLLNNEMTEIINFYRKEVAVWLGCFCNATCSEQMKVTVAGLRERVIGTVEQQTKMTPGVILEVKNAKNVLEMRLKGPKTRFTCCGLWEKKFEILDPANKVIGSIKQDMSSPFAHNFSITFPVVMDEKMKTILIGICFMISVRNNNVRTDGYAYLYTSEVTVDLNTGETVPDPDAQARILPPSPVEPEAQPPPELQNVQPQPQPAIPAQLQTQLQYQTQYQPQAQPQTLEYVNP